MRDIEERGFSLTAVTRLSRVQVSTALRGGHNNGGRRGVPAVLSANALRRVIAALALDEGKYADYLELAAPDVDLVCPDCGDQKKISRLAFTRILKRLRDGLEPLPKRRDDGAYSVAFGNCARSREIRKHWDERTPAERRDITHNLLGKEGREKQRAWASLPKSASHRAAMGRSRTHLLRIEGLRLCALCRLVMHAKTSAGAGAHWHPICEERWRSWLRDYPAARLDRPPGRPPGDNLDRNFRVLMMTRWDKEHRRSRRKILAEIASGIRPYATKGSPYNKHHDPTTVTKASDALIRLLPGSWDLVFSPRVTSADKRENRQSANAERQASVPLPGVLQPLIEAGARDVLILRLHHVRMEDHEIAGLIGAGEERVRAVIAASKDT